MKFTIHWRRGLIIRESNMMPEDWKEVERLYQAALELQPEERSHFLAACRNLDLRREVESLLKHRDIGNRFDRGALDMAADIVTGNQTIRAHRTHGRPL